MYSFITADKKNIENAGYDVGNYIYWVFILKNKLFKNTLKTFVTVSIIQLSSSFHFVKHNIVIIMWNYKTLNWIKMTLIVSGRSFIDQWRRKIAFLLRRSAKRRNEGLRLISYSLTENFLAFASEELSQGSLLCFGILFFVRDQFNKLILFDVYCLELCFSTEGSWD